MKNKILKYFIPIFTLVILITGATYLASLRSKALKNIDALNKSDTYIITIANDTFLDKYINKNGNTLVVFWSTLCSHCLDEAEDLNNFITINKDKYNIIVVSHDSQYSTLEEYLKEHNYNWNVILDSNKTIRSHIDPGTSGIPASYLLNNKGKIINYYKGEMTLENFSRFINLEKLENE